MKIKLSNAISAVPGWHQPDEAETIFTLSGGSLVNNTFAAPKTTGCGGIFSFFVGPLVDGILGLPSASGHNTAILEGKLQQAVAAAVKASE